MIDKGLKIFVLFSLILDILVRNFSNEFPLHFYYKAEALMIFSIAVLMYHYKRQLIPFIILGLALNNLLDEFFFNPLVFGLNELLTALFIIIYGTARFKQ